MRRQSLNCLTSSLPVNSCEEKYDYDQVLPLPRRSDRSSRGNTPSTPSIPIHEASIMTPDPLKTYVETQIGLQGMRIDRELFQKFGETVKGDTFIKEKYEEGDLDAVEEYVRVELLDKPEEPYTLETLRKAVRADRNISLREMIRNIFNDMPEFKSKDGLLEEAFATFTAIHDPDSNDIVGIKNFFKAYVTDAEIREIIDSRQFARLSTNPKLNFADFKALGKWRNIVIQYIKDNISLSVFE